MRFQSAAVLGIGLSITLGLNTQSGEPLGIHCDLWDDPQGIPHVRAASELDVFACMGFIHGRDRAWQMDHFRRITQGRTAEILGSDHVELDVTMRILDFQAQAAALYAEMSSSEQRLLSAYAQGANQGIATAIKNGVHEFTHWNYEPEAWEPKDSVALILLQSFDQTRRTFSVQFEEAEFIAKHGNKVGRLFNPASTPWDTAVLKAGEYPKGSSYSQAITTASERVRVPRAFESLFQLRGGIGSNNWVAGPIRTESGKALLANDPHLSLTHPPLWHWSHVESPDMDVIGAAMPGIPIIVSGTNRNVSWGVTNSYLTVGALTLVPESDLADAKSFRPVIWVKTWAGKVPVTPITFRRTPSGLPVLPLEAPSGKALVLTWTGFDLRASDFSGFFTLMKARSAREADGALARIGIPSWNFVYADLQGEIGFRAIGRVPQITVPRKLGFAELRLARLEEAWSKKRLLSPEEMPHVLNPARGYVATANNRHWPDNSAFHGGWGYFPGFRAMRIEELLLAHPKHTSGSFAAIQCDLQAVDARFLVPLLMSHVQKASGASSWRNGSDRRSKAIEHFNDWAKAQYGASLDCRACAIYRRWADRLMDTLVMNETALYNALLNSTEASLSRSVISALDASLGEVLDRSGNPPAWGNVHRNWFSQLASDDYFDEDGLPTPGDNHSVNPGTSIWEKGIFYHVEGASERLIVEMSHPPTVYSMLPGPNQDTETHDINDVNGPWRGWRDCRYARRSYPVNWNTVPAKKLTIR